MAARGRARPHLVTGLVTGIAVHRPHGEVRAMAGIREDEYVFGTADAAERRRPVDQTAL